MNIQTTHMNRYSPRYQAPAAATTPATESLASEPQDQVTFSEGRKNPALPILGMGVMMTGLMVGAQMQNPAVMLGAMFGGMAIMVAGS